MIALFSVFCIVLAIAIGFFRRVNVGVVSIGLSFLIGQLLASPRMPAGDIIDGWPFRLFFMLVGVTLMFGVARSNGTLALIAARIVEATRGRRRLIPPVFFVMSGVLAASGAGNIAVCALLLPIAMTISDEYEISPILMMSLTIAGANAGGLSPVAPTGIIAISLSSEAGFSIGNRVFISQIVGQSLMAATIFILLKGHRLENRASAGRMGGGKWFNTAQWLTIAVFTLVIGGVLFLKLDLGLAVFSGAAALLLLGAADEKSAMDLIPWSTLVLLCGVGMLVNVTKAVGGVDLMTHALSKLMAPRTAGAVMALLGGVLSMVSSASGVVLPTLIPTVSGLATQYGLDPAYLVSAITMGAHVVTNSPLSTLGALAIASAVGRSDRDRIFRNQFFIAFSGLAYAALMVMLGII